MPTLKIPSALGESGVCSDALGEYGLNVAGPPALPTGIADDSEYGFDRLDSDEPDEPDGPDEPDEPDEPSGLDDAG
jgi:hypothetical protein